MSIFKKIKTSYDDTFNIDAFGRLRVSQLTTQFDGKQLHDALPFYYDSERIGTGNIAHSTANAESTLTTAANSDAVVFQTKQRFNYMTGKSALGMQTFRNFNHETNITKRIGYFNSTTSTPFADTMDGFYLETTGTVINFVIAKAGTKNTIAQSSWNLDKVDGTGTSNVNLSLGTETGNLLMWWQFEWLGVGAVTFGFVNNGAFIPCHRVDHILGDAVYIKSPNHSLRGEIRQSGVGSGTFRIICSTFNVEGSLEPLGKILSDNLGTGTINANTVGTKYALLGIRLATAKVDTLVDILDYSLLTTTLDNQLVELWLNPTVAGTFTYNAVTNSSVEIAKGDVAGNPSTNTVTGGTLLYSDYISTQQSFNIQVQNAIRLGMTIAGVQDTLVLTTSPLTSNSDVTASIKWRELS